jgi:hypothetical protein
LRNDAPAFVIQYASEIDRSYKIDEYFHTDDVQYLARCSSQSEINSNCKKIFNIFYVDDSSDFIAFRRYYYVNNVLVLLKLHISLASG